MSPTRFQSVCYLVLLTLVASHHVAAWAPPSSILVVRTRSNRAATFTHHFAVKNNDDMSLHKGTLNESKNALKHRFPAASSSSMMETGASFFRLVAAPMLLLLLATPEMAWAADGVFGSAFAAYGHYFSILLMTACVTVERFTIKPNMSNQEEDRIAIADTVYGVAGLLLAYTGYLRVVQYGKGWDFYSHEPVFWLKIAFVGVLGALSFFNTIIIVQRSIAKNQNGGEIVSPMTEKLADKMNTICTAELSALASIPLTATLMSRGFLYNQSIPWQIGAVLAVLAFGGASYKYVSDALSWKEDEVVSTTE